MMKVLLIRPPRYLWPVVNESDNFMLPLGLPCLAASIKKELPDVDVKIIDCPPLKIGWKTLAKLIREIRPDVVGAGEEALYHHEAVKLFRLSKELFPSVVTVAGGHFFSWTARDSLKRHPFLDYIVRFEGEETFVELLRALREGSDAGQVKGLAFRREDRAVFTPARQLKNDLDEFPLPAYDLMPMGSYSPVGYFWPQGATIEHSRGCIDRCSFCSLWTFWGKHKNTDAEMGELDVSPRYRSKTVSRTLEEIDILYNKYNRRYLLWADPTFNVDPKWTEEFCERLLSRGYKDLYWWAFLRADFLVRDEKLGVLRKMVKAGLINAFIGVERVKSDDFGKMNKRYSNNICREAFFILKEKYPLVHRQGTFLTGIRGESREAISEMVSNALSIGVEFMMMHPVTPVPGTMLYQEAVRKGWLATKDFSRFDWLQPVMETGRYSIKETADMTSLASLKFILLRSSAIILKGFFSPVRYRRRLSWWFAAIFMKGVYLNIRNMFTGRAKRRGFQVLLSLHKPVWYDS
ncbi:MAG: radical SAM protein [Candidatus Omnitrophica bacterium]|jgi:anaerobic magnesium-protoporphyrin IX monomethyl ester cyclase|nr:radical SAM protein [Candidatus Omnitrophota bacterium]